MKAVLIFLGFLLLPGLAFCGGPGKRYALVVGIDNYQDSALTVLTSPQQDAIQLGQTLAPTWDKVIVMSDKEDPKGQTYPTRANIIKRLGLLADFAEKDDVIFIFFSGHGVASEGSEYLLPIDIDTNNLKGTGIKTSDLVEPFANNGIKNVVLALDACRETIYKTKGLKAVGVSGATVAGDAAAIFYSTKPGWYSYESQDGKSSVFTDFLLKGLAGAASQDGNVTIGSLANWLPTAVADWAMDHGIRQKPTILINDTSICSISLVKSNSSKSTMISDSSEKISKPNSNTYFSLTEKKLADGQIFYSITIKSAETELPYSRDFMTIEYTKNSVPELSSGNIYWNFSSKDMLYHWIYDEHFSAVNVITPTSITGTGLVDSQFDLDKKVVQFKKPADYLKAMIANDFVLMPESNKKVRYMMTGLKDFIELNGLILDDIYAAMENSHA